MRELVGRPFPCEPIERVFRLLGMGLGRDLEVTPNGVAERAGESLTGRGGLADAGQEAGHGGRGDFGLQREMPVIPALGRDVEGHLVGVEGNALLHNAETTPRALLCQALIISANSGRFQDGYTRQVARVRPVVNKSLGDFLVGLRGKMSQRDAVARANRRGLKLSYQALRDLEDGRIRHPRPDQLLALSELYRVSYVELVNRSVEPIYGTKVALTEPDTDPSKDGTIRPEDDTDDQTRLLRSQLAESQGLARRGLYHLAQARRSF